MESETWMVIVQGLNLWAVNVLRKEISLPEPTEYIGPYNLAVSFFFLSMGGDCT